MWEKASSCFLLKKKKRGSGDSLKGGSLKPKNLRYIVLDWLAIEKVPFASQTVIPECFIGNPIY